MLTSPRVIVIDDELNHVEGLSQSLNIEGVACLPIHFKGSPEGIKECPDVRVIFADLHLLGAETDHSTHFSTIGGLLEGSIKPTGPYFIVLWTKFPELAKQLFKFLDERVELVSKPVEVCPLDKKSHLDEAGKVKDTNSLLQKIKEITEEIPELFALLDWEEHVLRATGETVSAIWKDASKFELDERANMLGRILVRLGIASAGESHFEKDFFRAVNDALLPILDDRIANVRKDAIGSSVWQNLLSRIPEHTVSDDVVARLNNMVLFEELDSSQEHERGSVIELIETVKDSFDHQFGLDQEEAADSEFGCKDFESNDGKFRWVLVQIQAACDFAQDNPGLLPCYLGLEFPKDSLRKNKRLPEATWKSPIYELNGASRRLHVNARFPVSLSRSTFQTATPIYRLRDQVVNDLTHKMHSYGSRPGMLSFR